MSKGSKRSSKGGSTKGLVDLARINALLDEVLIEAEDEVPDGFTVKDYMNEHGVKKTKAYRDLKVLFEAGKVIRITHKRKCALIHYYQFKEE